MKDWNTPDVQAIEVSTTEYGSKTVTTFDNVYYDEVLKENVGTFVRS